jgi:hypothetical protein
MPVLLINEVLQVNERDQAREAQTRKGAAT